ncbi:MAG: hypothetical protein WKF73_08270 [Nocardioidaceae bacterium]
MGSLLELQVKGETYKVMRSPLSAFLESARRADLDDVVRPVRRGETVNLI